MIRISEASGDDLSALQNLLQLYLYDLTEFGQREVDAEGRFQHEPLDAYRQERSKAAFLARAWERPVAFALVNEHSVLQGEGAGVRTIGDLFVLRGYRRHGIGTRLAVDVFRRFPGRWEVRESDSNRAAQEFWRRVIDRYTGGRFVELMLDDGRWRGPVQTFDNSLMVG